MFDLRVIASHRDARFGVETGRRDPEPFSSAAVAFAVFNALHSYHNAFLSDARIIVTASAHENGTAPAHASHGNGAAIDFRYRT